MKKQKIAKEKNTYLVSSNNYEDDNCPVCLLMQECEIERREPTAHEIQNAMKECRT